MFKIIISISFLTILALPSCSLTSKSANKSPNTTEKTPDFSEVSHFFPEVMKGCNDVLCLLSGLYRDDQQAFDAAIDLYENFEVVAGVGQRQSIKITQGIDQELVPQAPIGDYRNDILWTLKTFRWMSSVLDESRQSNNNHNKFYWKGLNIAYMRSINGTRPSGWIDPNTTSGMGTIYYNVSGSLTKNFPLSRNMIIHEIFHINDFKRGNWSAANLFSEYNYIVDLCGNDTVCLLPYTPTALRLTGR